MWIVIHEVDATNKRRHGPDCERQPDDPKLFPQRGKHKPYFRVATNTSSSVSASVVIDSGENDFSCSMIWAAAPFAMNSRSRPFRRRCSAPGKLWVGASDSNRARIF